MFANPFGFDPSKLDPKTLMELSSLVRELPPQQLSRMQTLMHNTMGGFDVQKEMEEFERSLPPGFREKLTGIMMRGMAGASAAGPAPVVEDAQGVDARITSSESESMSADMSVREARLTVLRAVADGSMDPEGALSALWPSG
jgi:hypothetical protein